MSATPITGTLHGDTERSRTWLRVLGTTTVPLRSLIPHRARLPRVGVQFVYDLAVDCLTPDQTDRLVAYLSEEFGYAPAEVRAALPTEGCALLAEDITVVLDDPQRWLS